MTDDRTTYYSHKLSVTYFRYKTLRGNSSLQHFLFSSALNISALCSFEYIS